VNEHESRTARASPPAEDLAAQLEETRSELAACEDRYLRARADLDNYRKRTEREIEQRSRERSDALLRSWLEVVDSIERALALDAQPRTADELRAVLEQMEGLLARYGVTRLGEVGERFDPELHEAVAVVPESDREPGTIAEVTRSGYASGDRVLRPPLVAVAQPPGEA
jgi:molecular chaperone GrpE